MHKLKSFLLILVLMTLSCKKSETAPADVAPSNLTVNATVSTDNSGNVSFVATATDAVVYLFDFGNSSNQVSATGAVTCQYSSSGVFTVTVVAKSAGNKATSKSTTINVTVVAGLVWSDEFDVPGAPDVAKWGYDLGAGGWGNNESENYTNRLDNAFVSDGTLKIVLKKENYSGSTYTSARLLSKGKYSFKYGKIEVRAKLPAGGGTWPAIWMLGDNISTVGWPACGEVDIMEHVGNQQNKIFGTLHHPGHSGGNGDGSSVMVPTATTDFHKYTCDWNSASIKFSVDDVPFYTFANTGNLPFNQKFFIILNVAMGGNFGGTIDPAITRATMEIDYVRVYQ